MKEGRHRWVGLGLTIAFVVLVLDQLSKWWILGRVMQPPRLIEVTPFFNLLLVWNRGVSFGLFNNDAGWNVYVLPAVALIIVAGLGYWLWRVERRLIAVAIGMIMGGAIGNVIDRMRFGAVVDFLDVHIFDYHWPAFNIADSGITIGAIILVAEAVLPRREHVTTP